MGKMVIKLAVPIFVLLVLLISIPSFARTRENIISPDNLDRYANIDCSEELEKSYKSFQASEKLPPGLNNTFIKCVGNGEIDWPLVTPEECKNIEKYYYKGMTNQEYIQKINICIYQGDIKIKYFDINSQKEEISDCSCEKEEENNSTVNNKDNISDAEEGMCLFFFGQPCESGIEEDYSDYPSEKHIVGCKASYKKYDTLNTYRVKCIKYIDNKAYFAKKYSKILTSQENAKTLNEYTEAVNDSKAILDEIVDKMKKYKNIISSDKCTVETEKVKYNEKYNSGAFIEGDECIMPNIN
jgi:hypothetical protein